MSRLVLVVELKPDVDVEGYLLADRLADLYEVARVGVRNIDEGDELVKMSVVRDAIARGFEELRLTPPVAVPADPEATVADLNPEALEMIAQQREAARALEQNDRNERLQYESRARFEDLDARGNAVRDRRLERKDRP